MYTSGVQSGIAKISAVHVGWSKAPKAPSDQDSDTEYDPVLER